MDQAVVRISGLSNRASDSTFQVRVQARVRALNLYLHPNTCTRDLMAETRDLRILSGLRFPFGQRCLKGGARG